MAATTVTNLSAALREYWPQDTLKQHLFETAPTIGMIRKDETADGDLINHVIRYTPGPGRSKTFSTAQSNLGPSRYANFQLSLVDDYAVFAIEGKALRQAEASPLKALKQITKDGDAVLSNLWVAMGTALWGNSGGSIGQILSGSTSTVLTLTTDTNMLNFEVGQSVVSDDTDGSSGGADDGEAFAISAVDHVARTITKASGNWDAGGNFAANDYLFPEGDYGLGMAGIRGWVPATAPAAGDSFQGVDRSVSPMKLAGHQYTANKVTHGTLARFFVDVLSRMHMLGANKVDCIGMNPQDWAQFANEIGAKDTYTRSAQDADGEYATVGYATLKIMGPTGPVDVYADPFIPKGTAYALALDTWVLYSLGDLVGWLNEDEAGIILRQTTADAYEGRLGGYFQLGCDEPGQNAYLNISALVV